MVDLRLSTSSAPRLGVVVASYSRLVFNANWADAGRNVSDRTMPAPRSLFLILRAKRPLLKAFRNV